MTLESNILEGNAKNYKDLYSKQEAFLRYPADWVIRFHNMYLKKNLPSGRVLDYGCGSGNNSSLFIDKGYETYGVDVSQEAIDLVKVNLASRGLDPKLADNFSVISPHTPKLPFDNNTFDFILSNQVLYYLPNEQHI